MEVTLLVEFGLLPELETIPSIGAICLPSLNERRNEVSAELLVQSGVEARQNLLVSELLVQLRLVAQACDSGPESTDTGVASTFHGREPIFGESLIVGA